MKQQTYRLGLVSISFRQHTPREIAKAARDAGLTAIEWGSDVHAPPRDAEALDAIVNLQKEYSLSCASYGTYFRLGETPLDELFDYIAAAKHIGTHVLRLWCGTKSGAEYTTAEKENLFLQCKKAAEIAAKENVILCMECHKSTYTQSLPHVIELIKVVNSSHFRMYWQPFQWQEIEQNIAYAKAIAPYTHHVHVFHWKGKQRLSLEDGIDEWRNYLGLLPPPRTLLLEFMPDDRLQTLPHEVHILKKLIGDPQ